MSAEQRFYAEEELRLCRSIETEERERERMRFEDLRQAFFEEQALCRQLENAEKETEGDA